jgi:hypothetical protein
MYFAVGKGARVSGGLPRNTVTPRRGQKENVCNSLRSVFFFRIMYCYVMISTLDSGTTTLPRRYIIPVRIYPIRESKNEIRTCL